MILEALACRLSDRRGGLLAEIILGPEALLLITDTVIRTDAARQNANLMAVGVAETQARGKSVFQVAQSGPVGSRPHA